MQKKFNTLFTGIVIGTLLPIIFYYIFVMPTMRKYQFIADQYGEFMVKMLPIFLSRCIFPNALIFFLLLWLNQAKAAKGLLITTAVMTALLLIINFIL
jgi:hypothetical protein